MNRTMLFHRRRRITKRIERATGDGRVLEIGCGTSDISVILRKEAHYVGTDVSRWALRRGTNQSKRASFLRATGTSLPFPTSTFNSVVAFDVLEHLPQPESCLREISRVARPGALVFLSTPNTRSFGLSLKGRRWHGFRDPTHCSIKTRAQWERLISVCGLRVEEVQYDGLIDTPYITGLPEIPQHLLIKFPFLLWFEAGFPVPERFGENLYFVCRNVVSSS